MLVGTFVSGEIGDFALSVVSQTSSGSTSENSRKTRSQATRLVSAVLSAPTRALCSPASCCCAADGPGRGRRESLVGAVQVVDLALLRGDLATAHHEHRAEGCCDQDSGAGADEDRQALFLDRALRLLSRE